MPLAEQLLWGNKACMIENEVNKGHVTSMKEFTWGN